MSTKKAFTWVIFWIDLALLFDLGILIFLGKKCAMDFLGGYVIEQSLSIDNLFLFIVLFTSFNIRLEYQRRVLTYGIAGAAILRFMFIVLGVTIVRMFHWILYVFGVILILSGLHMMLKRENTNNLKESKVIKGFGKIISVTETMEGDRFFIKKDKRTYATPLFAILILIEFTDLLFAIDSIPAIFSITTDPFIVYTSNLFAILGLRNMYFVLGKLHEKFRYVKYGVSAILSFTGIKLVVLFFDIHIPTELSLFVILTILCGSILASVLFTGKSSHEPMN